MGEPLAIIPAVSLKDGEVVVVRNHAYEPLEDEGGAPFAIDEFFEVFLKEFPAVCVFDINGIEGQGAQYDAASSLDRAASEVWWDAGARDHHDVISVITSGVDRAVVSTRSLRNLRELSKAVELTENIVFEVVLRDGAVQGEGKEFRARAPEAVARDAGSAGAESFLLLDSSRPLGAPVEWAAASKVAPHAKALYIGGGLELDAARGLVAPPGVPLKGALVDLISVLARYL